MTLKLNDLWNEISNDRSRGSTELAEYCLKEILRRTKNQTNPNEISLDSIGRRLINVRSEMSYLVNLGYRLLHLKQNSQDDFSGKLNIIEALHNGIQKSSDKILQSFDNLKLSSSRVLVFSRSGTVQSIVDHSEQIRKVHILESHPGGEGRTFSNALSEENDVKFHYDVEAGRVLDDIDALILGADGYDKSGAILNKVGTSLLARATRETPVITCFQSLKYSPEDSDQSIPTVSSPEAIDEALSREHPIFEWTGSRYIDYYVTDRGAFKYPESLFDSCQDIAGARANISV